MSIIKEFLLHYIVVYSHIIIYKFFVYLIYQQNIAFNQKVIKSTDASTVHFELGSCSIRRCGRWPLCNHFRGIVPCIRIVLYVTRGNERRTISHSVLSHVLLCYRWTLPRQRAWKMKVWRYATVATIICPIVLGNVNFCGLKHRCNAYKRIVSNGHWLVVASISWHISLKWIE